MSGSLTMARWFRPELLRVAGVLWLISEAVLLAFHLKRETLVGLTAGGTTAFGDDTINFWAAARLAQEGRVADIYDFAKFHQFQTNVLGGPVHLYHYAYPPVMILLSLPLGLFPYVWSLVVWLVGGLLIFAATVRAAWRGSLHNAWDCTLYALAVPSVLVNCVTGQTGTWTAGLLGGGLLVLERRPVLSGILLGGLVAKPQMAMLVPFALLAGRRWTALIASAITALALIGVSVLAFGTAPWLDFARRVTVLRHWILEDGAGVWHLFVSVFVSVRHLPAPVPVAWLAQSVATVFALLLVLRSWRSSAPQGAKSALLVMSGFFATPYVQVYDLPVTALVPLWLLPMWPENDAGRSRALAAFALLMLAPIVVPGVARVLGFGIGWLLLMPALLVAVAACGQERDRLRLAEST
jgi:hypothetical protein